MRRALLPWLIAGLTLTGCGGLSPQSPTATTAGNLPIQLSVLDIEGPSEAIPKNNTCSGADTPLSVHWSGIPLGTAELALFIINLRARNGGLFIDWAVTGLSPTSRGIASGMLPSGAVAGRNSYGSTGYSICPPKHSSETYIARLVALRQPLQAHTDFNAEAYYIKAVQLAKVMSISSAGTYIRR